MPLFTTHAYENNFKEYIIMQVNTCSLVYIFLVNSYNTAVLECRAPIYVIYINTIHEILSTDQ